MTSPRTPVSSLLRLVAVLGLLVMTAGPTATAATLRDWAKGYNLVAPQSLPLSDPDGDGVINALEFAFGTSPVDPGEMPRGIELIAEGGLAKMIYPVGKAALGEATFRVHVSEMLSEDDPGSEVSATPFLEAEFPGYRVYSQHFDLRRPAQFYRLLVSVPYPPVHPEQGVESLVQVLVGTQVGSSYWEGMSGLAETYVRLQAPDVSADVPLPNVTKYPSVVGTQRVAATQDLLDSLAQTGRRLSRRSWMGWFLWADGTPPPGLSPGYPATGTYDTNQVWDFFSFQFPAQGTNQPPPGQTWSGTYGAWQPIRLDQQPLYINPFRINNAWPAGAFGYRSQPLTPFADQTGYWSEKRIVRGPNLSLPNPFFVQYGDRVTTGDSPDAWRESWLYQRTRPLETLVLVPSNLKPDQILQAGTWNATDTAGQFDPYPYPIWDTALAPKDQTPFAILVDRMGDWDADLIWEGTHKKAAGYETNRYRRTAFNQPGQGNYLKMTVSQGSPFVWCETHNNRYQVFYNLIRQNLKGSIANASGTDAKVVPGGPWPVPGVADVSYVLLYGDHNNPNQWHHAEPPLYVDMATGIPGGFNPPGAQHNHTYVAVFYRTSTVQPVTLGAGGAGAAENNGIDAHGNPYFYLEFKQAGKNWFVVGAVPVMSYYHSGVPVDSEDARIAGARGWAETLGQYAFNFTVGTRVSYAADNMTTVSTTYEQTVRNPFVAAGDATAMGLTANATDTVTALMPHHYQPLTLGPDLTRAARPQVTWNPLSESGAEFPIPANAPPNANRNDPATPSRWGYWSPRGNMKAVVGSRFVTTYPFQNFLPVMPPADLAKRYPQTGVQAVRITDVGTGNARIQNPVPNAVVKTAAGIPGAGAVLNVLLEDNTGRVQQVDVITPGSGYPDGNPPDATQVWIEIDAPRISAANGGRQARARLQIGGGKVLAAFMDDKGAGYDATLEVTQAGATIDPPIIVPPYDEAGQLKLGLATVISGGAGFDFGSTATPPTLTFRTLGTGARAEIVRPGNVLGIGPAAADGFTDKASYPSSGDDAEDAARVVVEMPPPPSGGPAQTARVTRILRKPGFITAVLDRGQYASAPTASITNDLGEVLELGVNFGGSQVINVYWALPTEPPLLRKPQPVNLVGGNPARSARIMAYGTFSVMEVEPTGALVTGYTNSVVARFSGGDILDPAVRLPKLAYTILPDGSIDPASLQVVDPGAGWTDGGVLSIVGGQGEDAAASAVLGSSGQIIAVKVLRSGNNYPNHIFARVVSDSGTGAELAVRVEGGRVVGIDVVNGGTGYLSPPTVLFSSSATAPVDQSPPKGGFAEIIYGVNGSGGLGPLVLNKPGAGYIPGTENGPTPDSPGTSLRFDGPGPVAHAPSQAKGFVAQVMLPDVAVGQVIYDNLIIEYAKLGSLAERPFGGSFGGASGPDGYGLGNQLSASAKLIGVLYNFQQHYAGLSLDLPEYPPGDFAYFSGNTPESAYDWPIYRTHQPMLTLGGALKTSVQGLQRTLTLLEQKTPYSNAPAASDWTMQYFSQYDAGAGRLIVNPSGTIPVEGVVSSVPNPPAVPDAENQAKDGLKRWHPGMLWSGFGASDQWNDQHYFFGYYLSTAALLAILDHSWEPNLAGKPAKVWADADQAGMAIDQWLMTLANDPDNAALQQSLHVNPSMTYQKMAFFDAWNGHAWATGVSPGRAGDVEDGRFGANVPWSVWRSKGTGDAAYDDENENSAWEGLQAWSAIALWGGGTDRKPIVDLGMYLLANGNAASDLYFHDKNYNLARSARNQFSWVPVTTTDSSTVANNGGNTSIPADTGFVETTPEAFYTAPEAFGGAASAGTSILHKGSPSLNNFFYAFPTGSKFIQSFPPAPWTLGMARNSDYMRRWAGSMMRPEWRAARDSSLYQPADWLGLALASAVSGVPYNPGDQPYPLTGTTPATNAPQPYVERLWSSWVTREGSAGASVARPPAFKPLEVLTFMHTLDAYGTPDWTYVARNTDASGAPDGQSIVFTAAFTRAVDATKVRTTFVAMNPGWSTRHVAFYRLSVDGTIPGTPVLPSMPISVAPKRLFVLTQEFAVQ